MLNELSPTNVVLLNKKGIECFYDGYIDRAAEYYEQALKRLFTDSSDMTQEILYSRKRKAPEQVKIADLSHLTTFRVESFDYDEASEDDDDHDMEYDSWQEMSAIIVIYNLSLVYFVKKQWREAERLLSLLLQAGGIPISNFCDIHDLSTAIEETILAHDDRIFPLVVVSSYHLLGQISCFADGLKATKLEQLCRGMNMFLLAIAVGQSCLSPLHFLVGSAFSTLGHALIYAHCYEEAMGAFARSWDIARYRAIIQETKTPAAAAAA